MVSSLLVKQSSYYLKSLNFFFIVVLTTILLFCMASWLLLQSLLEKVIYVTALIVVCFLAPTWKFYLQGFKKAVYGPWDIAHIRR